MTDTFNNGPADTPSDCRVAYTPGGPAEVVIHSRVQALYGASIVATVQETLRQLSIVDGKLEMWDGGALPFVIQARVEAAVKAAYPGISAMALPPVRPGMSARAEAARRRRTRLYLPGDQPKLMLNAGLHRPDGIILDLEDSVAPAEKAAARLIVRNALRVLDFRGAERMVRINKGDLGVADIAAVVPHPVHTLLLPKVENAAEVASVDALVRKTAAAAGREAPVYLIPIVESAAGVINAAGIAAASPRVVALAIGLEDYSADIGARRTLSGRESLYAQSAVINAAKAAGKQALASVFSDVRDDAGLQATAEDARALGFDGMGCIHPRQIAVIHTAFAPTEAEIAYARLLVRAYEEAVAAGRGVVALGSKMIDPPVVQRALRTLRWIGERDELDREGEADGEAL